MGPIRSGISIGIRHQCNSKIAQTCGNVRSACYANRMPQAIPDSCGADFLYGSLSLDWTERRHPADELFHRSLKQWKSRRHRTYNKVKTLTKYSNVKKNKQTHGVQAIITLRSALFPFLRAESKTDLRSQMASSF